MATLIERAKEVRSYTETAAQLLPDDIALKAKALYPRWEDLVEEGKKVTAGFRFMYGNNLMETVQPEHTFTKEHTPGATGTESLFKNRNESNAGSREDPIPYNGNMDLLEGKYYSQDGVVYLCTRDTGIAVHHALADLVGLYVEPAE